MTTASILPDQDTVVAEVFIAAPPERVYQAITDPAQTAQWWGQKGMYRLTGGHADVRPGGKWFTEGMGADGKSFRVEGEYVEIDPPRLLVHTWQADFAKHPKNTVVRWELEPQSVHALHPSGPQRAGTGTLVKVRHEGFAGNLASAMEHSEGWKRVLGWLVGFTEQGATIDTRG